ncbi:MAG TPA: hypothetical protein VMR98_06250, partial [Candidatus Polarisedimenticolaceae bacterium]|nr:hypothetical protein [Candidatus Polarisedimenticolaceae bacterium]
ALSFVDDVAWWAGGKTENEVACSLERAAEASLTWAANNGIAFDHGKTEAALFGRKQSPPHGAGEGRKQDGPLQQGSDTMARDLA